MAKHVAGWVLGNRSALYTFFITYVFIFLSIYLSIIYYLSILVCYLYNKLPQEEAAYNNNNFYPLLASPESGIWKWLSWVVLVQQLS